MTRAEKMAELIIQSAAETQRNRVSFGEVMLRFGPGFGRVRNTAPSRCGKAAASTTAPAPFR